MFYVIDGSDGSGKRTQAELLQKYFKSRGEEALLISFPRYGETFFGKLLKDLLTSPDFDFISVDPRLASLPYAGDRFESSPEIRAALKKGAHVICDRYASASQIHQGGKISDIRKRAEFLSWLEELEYKKFGIAYPDKSVYLEVPVEVSLHLMADKAKDAAENNIQHLKDSVDSAKWLIAQNPDKWIHIQCAPGNVMRSREDIHQEIVEKLEVGR